MSDPQSAAAAEIAAEWAGFGGKREIIAATLIIPWISDLRRLGKYSIPKEEIEKAVLSALVMADQIMKVSRENPPK